MEKLFFNKGLIIGLILLGKVWALNLAIAFAKSLFFLLLAPGSALEKFSAFANPANKPTKVNWTLSWPSAFEICDLVFFGKVWALNLAIAFVKGNSFFSWLQDKLWKSLLHL